MRRPLLLGLLPSRCGRRADRAGSRHARSGRRHGDAQRGARLRRAGVDRHHRRRDRSATASRRSTSPSRWSACRACSPPTARTTRRTCRSARAGFGARATFGVRGVRLYQDDIPATMPDGQGQTGSFSLLSAERIEVLRGPFSTLYGNASGRRDLGVHRGRHGGAGAERTASGGSYTTLERRRQGRRARRARSVTCVAGNYFDTDGYRDHSRHARGARQCQARVRRRRRTRASPSIGNSQYQPRDAGPARSHARAMGGRIRGRPTRRHCCSTRARPINQMQGGVGGRPALRPTDDVARDGLRRPRA